jgi:Kef-type K+ transport system membrane component KefB
MVALMFPVTDYVLIFTIIISVILVSLLLASKLKIPDLVLLLLAGVVLGEHGMNILVRSSAITLFGEIGLIYIMFLAGLEIDLYQFSRTKRKSVGFGLLTFVIPQVLGATAVYILLGGISWTSAILMASMFASHTLLAYPAASRLGVHRSEPVTISVGATIITDTLALLVLAVVVDAAQGEKMGWLFWGGLFLALFLLVVLISQLIPRIARWFFQNVTESGGAQFLFVLALVCACAYFSQYARMKPIIGAFLAGAAFNRQIPEHSPLMNRLVFAGNTLFIPFFLISVGMLVDPRVLVGDPRTWQVIGVMVGMVIVTKFLAAWIGGWILGYTRPERAVMFGLTVVQAAATLAAALVGFEAGILDEAALNGSIAMIMVTVPLGSWVTDAYGRKMAMASIQPRQSHEKTEQRLLIPIHNPVSAARMMELAFLIRDPAVPGGLYPLTIVREQTDTEEAVSRGEKLLAQCMTHASSVDIEVEPHVRVDLNPVDGIARAVRELRTGTVIAGWGGDQNRSSRIFGSTNQKLTLHCPCRLMICRILRPPNTTRSIRICFPPLSDQRDDLDQLMREARLLAKQAGADLQVYVSEDTAAELEARMEKIGPGCSTTYHISTTWAETRKEMFDHIHEDDLIVLPQIRRNTLLWTPTLDRLPELIAERYPQSNLIVVYPALRTEALNDNAPAYFPETDSFPAVYGVNLSSGLSAADRIRTLAQEGLRSDPDMALAAVPLLEESARLNPVELAPGTILLHAHCGQQSRPILLIGYSRTDAPFFELPKTPRLLVCLLSPRGDSPALHLQALAKVARKFHQPDLLDKLNRAADADEVCSVLSN